MTARIAVYPGTFDPVTNGHIDLIRRGAALFDRVVVGVAVNPQKETLFSSQERVEMVRRATRGMPRVRIETFDDLVVSFARRRGARTILRGMRMLSDFEYEFQMALTNRKLAGRIETVFMLPSEEYSYLSSRLIKEAAALGADLKGLVPAFVDRRLREKLA